MKKQKSLKYEENQYNFKTIRLGVKQHIIAKDIDKFSIITIYKPAPYHTHFAVLTNHEVIYLFNHKFGINKLEDAKDTLLSDACEVKINLRLQYKLPPALHLKIKYSYNLQCIFVMLANSQIAVLTDQLYLIGLVELVCCDPQNNIKYCLDYEYYEKQAFRQSRIMKNGYFVLLFSDSIEVHEVEMVTNHKLSKFKPSYKFSLTQLSKKYIDRQIKHPVNLLFFPFFRSHQFTKSTQKFNNIMVLSVNCLKEVTFYFIGKDSMNIEQNIKVSKNQLNAAHVMDIDISALNKRIFIALNNGTVKTISFKQETFAQTLYTIKISDNPIIKICLQSFQRLLSFSKDNVVSIINLHTLSVEQKFKLGDCIQFCFINEHYFITVGNKSHNAYNASEADLKQDEFARMLILDEFNCKYEKIFECNADIIQYLLEQKRDILQLSDNSLLINKYDENDEIQVLQTYLPPRSVSVKCIHKNPFTHEEQYWILTQKSEIYKYKISNTIVNVSEVIQLYRFIDKNDTQHRYIVTYFCFLTRIIPLEYDSETTEKQYINNEKLNEELKPICLGTNTGQILIASIDKITNIICRMRSIQTPITNIIELHPVSSSLPKGLVIYESKRIQKAIIVQLTPTTHPIEHFRINTRGGWFKSLSNEFFSTINEGAFSIFYCMDRSNEIHLYREQHYNPGLLENSKISAISLCISQHRQFIMVGFTLGQILIYHLHRNLNQNTYIHLNLLYYLENSKEEPIQFIRFNHQRIYFNLGSFLIWDALPETEIQYYFDNADQNYHLDKSKGSKQFNFSEKRNNPQKEIHTTKEIEKVKEVKLPLLKPQKMKSNRSSSVGALKSDKSTSLKPQLMFHFPDIQLYRSLINRSIIQ